MLRSRPSCWTCCTAEKTKQTDPTRITLIIETVTVAISDQSSGGNDSLECPGTDRYIWVHQ
jgi:hypothetical protein